MNNWKRKDSNTLTPISKLHAPSTELGTALLSYIIYILISNDLKSILYTVTPTITNVERVPCNKGVNFELDVWSSNYQKLAYQMVLLGTECM